uniref:Uncharacterized protein n=1 Tax=Rhizophora mucronata TaxID=61149 RepID=A0A2P2PDB2_RHIMU
MHVCSNFLMHLSFELCGHVKFLKT